MRFLLSAFLLLVLIASPIWAAPYENKLPVDAAEALHASEKVILYSLEPTSWGTTNNLQGFKILGQATLDGKQAVTAVAAFESAICKKEPKFEVLCFDPRHAIRVKSKGHTFDFLLCYNCSHLYIYRDNNIISELDAKGSPKVLNDLLTINNIPLSKSNE